jgi:hypothetical protein
MNERGLHSDSDAAAIGVPEADAQEQQAAIDDEDQDVDEELSTEVPLEADPADVVEQSVPVPLDDGDRDAPPHPTD